MPTKRTKERRPPKAEAATTVSDESKAVALRAASNPPATLEIPPEMSAIIVRSPGQIIDNAIEVSQALNRVLEKRPDLVVQIEQARFPKLEVWTTLGFLLKGFTGETIRPLVQTVTEGKDDDGNTYFVAFVNAVTDGGVVVGSGEGECNMGEMQYRKKEGGMAKRWKERHAARSMAQTRASSKAMRLPLSWIIVLSGLQPTPAEEMDESAMESQRESGRTTANAKKASAQGGPAKGKSTGSAEEFRLNTGDDKQHNGARYEPTLIDERGMQRILETPADTKNSDGSAVIGEELRRQFVWTAATKIARADEKYRDKMVMLWGSFDDKAGAKVWGPMPWETYRTTGDLKMCGKWLNRTFHLAKEDYQLWLVGSHPSQIPDGAQAAQKTKGKKSASKDQSNRKPKPATTGSPRDEIAANIPEASAIEDANSKRAFIQNVALEIAKGDVVQAGDWIAEWTSIGDGALGVRVAKAIGPKKLDSVYTAVRQVLIDLRTPLDGED